MACRSDLDVCSSRSDARLKRKSRAHCRFRLIDLRRHCSDLSQTRRSLIRHVDKCIVKIEKRHRRKIKNFYIGKTYVRQRKDVKFNLLDWSTWNTSGIKSRFAHHQQTEYGQSGSVVLAVVTEDALPCNATQNKSRITPEGYALTLENALIEHYLYERDDPRIENRTRDPGKKDHDKSIGYALYMAFRLEDRGSEERSSENGMVTPQALTTTRRRSTVTTLETVEDNTTTDHLTTDSKDSDTDVHVKHGQDTTLDLPSISQSEAPSLDCVGESTDNPEIQSEDHIHLEKPILTNVSSTGLIIYPYVIDDCCDVLPGSLY